MNKEIEITELPDLGGTRRRRMGQIIFRRLSSVSRDETDDELREKVIGDIKEFINSQNI